MRAWANARTFPSTGPFTRTSAPMTSMSPFTWPLTVRLLEKTIRSPSTSPSIRVRSAATIRSVLHLLAGRKGVCGIAMLYIRSRHRLRHRQRAGQSAQHKSDRREPLPLLPQQPDRHHSQGGHGHEFHQASHRIPSFPESAAKKEHGEQISLRKATLLQIGIPRLNEAAPERVGAADKQSECRHPAPVGRVALRGRQHTGWNRFVVHR